MSKLIKANESDFNRIKEAYIEIIDSSPDMDKYVKWKYGMHPNDEMIQKYIEEGSMYMYLHEGNIAGMIAVTPYQNADYRAVDWQIEAKDDEVIVLHLLGVITKYQGNGIAKEIIENALELGRDNNAKACRLDALSINVPAQKMYERLGFSYRGSQNWYAENTGWIDFYLYELVL